MPKFRHYSPQLSRELVRRLYYEAKQEQVPMTVLANKLLQQALDYKNQTNKRTMIQDQHTMESK